MLEILVEQEMSIIDVSFDVSPQITKDIAGKNTTPEKWGKRMVYTKVSFSYN